MMGNVARTPLYLSPLLRRYFNSGNPEFYGSAYNVYKSDVYSLGMIFLYLASLNSINGLCNFDNLEGKIKRRVDSLPVMYPRIKYLLESMLQVHEQLRPDFIQLKNKLERVSDILLSQVLQKCEVCDKDFLETELDIFTSGVFCKDCYSTVRETFYPNLL